MSAELATLTGDLVQRARLGDQNAMALIAETRKAAGQGVAKAKRAYSLIMKYIKENPYDEFRGEEIEEVKFLIHGEKPLELFDALGNCDSYIAGTLLADGPAIDWKSIGKSLQGRERTVFFHAVRDGRSKTAFHGVKLNEREQQLAKAGRAYCICRAITEVRKPNTPITPFSKMVGWELGE